MRFLPIGVPYHSHLLAGCTARALAALRAEEASHWTPSDLTFAVYNTHDGTDLRDVKTNLELFSSLFSQVFSEQIYWSEKATQFPSSATHVIDFGTGGASGIGSLCIRNWEGRGIRTILLGNRAEGVGAGKEAWSTGEVLREKRWKDQFSPRLVRTSDGRVHIDTPFSRLLNKPPLMVAGMYVAPRSSRLLTRAGPRARCRPASFRQCSRRATTSSSRVVDTTTPRRCETRSTRSRRRWTYLESASLSTHSTSTSDNGTSLAVLCAADPRRTFQLPLWQQMKKEGLPIEGLCVAAGIPSSEKAKEIIDGLRDAGIKHISFKPGSVDGIRQVINIAGANPDYPIILQWTGGRAGGHHSCEDFHAPILATYSSIRARSNIILVGGSGFGDDNADDTYPYLSGAWSEAFGVMRMPFDGFLFASRVMVAKEAHTSETIKQLIVDAQGVDDHQWCVACLEAVLVLTDAGSKRMTSRREGSSPSRLSSASRSTRSPRAASSSGRSSTRLSSPLPRTSRSRSSLPTSNT